MSSQRQWESGVVVQSSGTGTVIGPGPDGWVLRSGRVEHLDGANHPKWPMKGTFIRCRAGATTSVPYHEHCLKRKPNGLAVFVSIWLWMTMRKWFHPPIITCVAVVVPGSGRTGGEGPNHSACDAHCGLLGMHNLLHKRGNALSALVFLDKAALVLSTGMERLIQQSIRLLVLKVESIRRKLLRLWPWYLDRGQGSATCTGRHLPQYCLSGGRGVGIMYALVQSLIWSRRSLVLALAIRIFRMTSNMENRRRTLYRPRWSICLFASSLSRAHVYMFMVVGCWCGSKAVTVTVVLDNRAVGGRTVNTTRDDKKDTNAKSDPQFS